MAHRVIGELIIASRFAVVGTIATMVHMAVAWLLASRYAVPVFRANLFAYLCAFGVSFVGHHLWTFGATGRIGSRLVRFVIVSVAAFGCNTAVLAVVLSTGILPPGVSAVVAVAVVPLLTFAGSRLWGFRRIIEQ